MRGRERRENAELGKSHQNCWRVSELGERDSSCPKQPWAGRPLACFEYLLNTWLCEHDLTGSPCQPVTDIAVAPRDMPLASDFTCSTQARGHLAPTESNLKHTTVSLLPCGSILRTSHCETANAPGESFNQRGPCLPSFPWTVLEGTPDASQEVLDQRPLR